MTAPKNVVLGIDLGTTNSCVAELSEISGQPVPLENFEGGSTTPSVVYFESPEHIPVGVDARRLAAARPELVCAQVKRLMSMQPDERGGLLFHDVEYTPEEVSALILTKVVKDALATKQLPPDTHVRAVVTVPAYFGTIGKNATLQAGKLAGIDVLYLAPEPVAAAIAYAASEGVAGQQTVLVYDLGGGTFDVAVVRTDGLGAAVVAFEGERVLGGLDWDASIVEWIRERAWEEKGVELPTDDAVLHQQLLERAEEAKKSLTRSRSTEVAFYLEGRLYSFQLTRETFEEITRGKLDVTIRLTRNAIDTARAKGVTQIDRLLLVGGSSRMPAVTERLQAETGLPAALFKPDHAVAMGAAVLANLVEDGTFEVDLTGTAEPLPPAARLVSMLTPKSLGLQLVDPADSRDYVGYVVPKNSELPAKASIQIETVVDQQTLMNIRVFEQRGEESEEPGENTLLHETPIALPHGLPKGAPLEAEFRVDDAGVLHVFLTDQTTGKTWEIKVDRLRAADADDLARLTPAIRAVA